MTTLHIFLLVEGASRLFPCYGTVDPPELLLELGNIRDPYIHSLSPSRTRLNLRVHGCTGIRDTIKRIDGKQNAFYVALYKQHEYAEVVACYVCDRYVTKQCKHIRTADSNTPLFDLFCIYQNTGAGGGPHVSIVPSAIVFERFDGFCHLMHVN